MTTAITQHFNRYPSGINGDSSCHSSPVTRYFSTTTREINYISSPYGVIAAYITENGNGQLYYLYKDHLGSITAIANQSGTIEYHSFDAKRLLYTMGHEFVHVSQYAILGGQLRSILTEYFFDMMDFHAYSYESSLGSPNTGGFTPADAIRFSNSSFSGWYQSLNYTQFSWTFNHSFLYPF